MAKKRFMDCDIWQKKNFRELEPKLKLAWFYLITNCSHAGIYEVDIPLMSFKIGDDYTLDEVKKSFEKNPHFTLDYFQIADEATLLPCLRKNKNKKYRAFIAVFVNKIRLIDTISLN